MKRSAGILVHRRSNGTLEVLLVHPGGPFFRRKDAGVWTIPKGEPDEGEELEETARRELLEETGLSVEGELLPLGEVVQKGGKHVEAWAVEAEIDTSQPPPSNTFELEWPPRSGKRVSFPEIDAWGFFDLATAREKIRDVQAAFLDRLEEALARE